uniref:Sphingomyelin synthase 2a n=1 Tax=Xiphophorus couchianus TaxID=32473 RepID=A0A3B5LN36_9TELE
MASAELRNPGDSSTPNLTLGTEDGSTPGTIKSCPVHASAGDEAKRSFRKGIVRHKDYVKISLPESKVNHLPTEWWKTVIAFFYAAFNLVLTTVVITVVHERVPPKESSPPLPDKFFDYIDRVKWAFTVTEINGMVLVAIWLIQLFFFKYNKSYFKSFLIYIFLDRAMKWHYAKIQRVLQLISGAGLSITNSHLLCGDFLYSGHTVMLTLTYLFIKEYSPKSFWWYHLLCWLLSAVGVLCILVAHEHYTVDVIVAYFITSRLFWWYHTMANLQTLKCSPNNYLTNTWWNPVFNFFERNVQTSVPCSYTWPISWASSCLKNPCKAYSMVQSSREE